MSSAVFIFIQKELREWQGYREYNNIKKKKQVPNKQKFGLHKTSLKKWYDFWGHVYSLLEIMYVEPFPQLARIDSPSSELARSL